MSPSSLTSRPYRTNLVRYSGAKCFKFMSAQGAPGVLNEENPEESDFEYYSLAGENDSCLFGQRVGHFIPFSKIV